VQIRNSHMTCIEAVIWQAVPEETIFNSSFQAKVPDQPESEFWGNTYLYMTNEMYGLIGNSAKGPSSGKRLCRRSLSSLYSQPSSIR
jgi:hypothetical protein